MNNSNTESKIIFRDLVASHTGLHSGQFLNTTDSEIELKQGIIVLDRSPHPDNLYRYIEPFTKNSDPDKIIGICVFPGSKKLKKATSTGTDFIVGGEIFKNSLVLPEGVNLDTVLNGGSNTTQKTLKDILHALGFNLNDSVKNSSADNQSSNSEIS